MKWLFNVLLCLFYPSYVTELEHEVSLLWEERTKARLHVRVLKKRIDSWIVSGERDMYRRVDIDTHHQKYLEEHANNQAKIINYIDGHMSTMYPTLVEKARRHVQKANGS